MVFIRRICKIIICLILCYIAINYISVSAKEDNAHKSFGYYEVYVNIYDKFLQNINMDFLRSNSQYINVSEGEAIYIDEKNSGTIIDAETISELSDKYQIQKVLVEFGLNAEIYDYAFFKVKDIPTLYHMPFTIWLNTSEGIKFVTLCRGVPNYREYYKIEILDTEEYVKIFSMLPAKVFVNGEESGFSYAIARNDGAELSLKSLVENVGAEYTWDKMNQTIAINIFPDKASNKALSKSINIRIALNTTDKDYYSANILFDNYDNKKENVEYNVFCKIVDDEIIINNKTADFILYMMCADGNGYVQVNASEKFVNVSFNCSIVEKVYINNKKVMFNYNAIPIEENNRILVPMRRIFEELGADVSWDNETNTAIAKKGDVEIKLCIDSDVMIKNGEQIKLDTPARLIDDAYTFVPLRAVSEAFGCTVKWTEELKRVDILTAK